MAFMCLAIASIENDRSLNTNSVGLGNMVQQRVNQFGKEIGNGPSTITRSCLAN